jgi:hypothetical protein
VVRQAGDDDPGEAGHGGRIEEPEPMGNGYRVAINRTTGALGSGANIIPGRLNGVLPLLEALRVQCPLE